MGMWLYAASSLTLWVYAARYILGGLRAQRANARFQFTAIDGVFLQGKTTSPRLAVAIGAVLLTLPAALIARLAWIHGL